MQGGNDSNPKCFSVFVAVCILPEPQEPLEAVSLGSVVGQLQTLRAAGSISLL